MGTIDAFLSCSFADEDKDAVAFISAIARGLGFNLVNVSTGSPNTPPEVARGKIASAQCLIAVCTKRSELTSGAWVMPQAVQDEIAIAYGTDTPALMFVERDVELGGFKNNFGTYHTFDRSTLQTGETTGALVEALHDLRVSIADSGVTPASGMSGSYAEFVHHLVELEAEGEDYIWEYSTSKRLVYSHPARGSFPAGVWATVPGVIPPDAPLIDWEVNTVSSSNGIKVVPTIQKRTAYCVEARVRMEPVPDSGDFVEYATFARSRYFNPIWEHETESPPIHLESGQYGTCDGLLFIHRTQKAVMEFRFARSYGLQPQDIVPFVANYTSGVDYEVVSELKRAEVRVEEFGGSVLVRIEVESPVPNLFYGVAWNPKPDPNKSGHPAG